jgi:hypothetical protein
MVWCFDDPYLIVGLAHFSVGYIFTYAAFLIASTSGKFGLSIPPN